MSDRVIFCVLKLLQIWTVLLTISPAFAGYVWDKSMHVHKELPAPTFDIVDKELEGASGDTILLPCTVRHLGDKVVSWIRTKDLSILTSGSFTFSADNRFESVYLNEVDFWGLRIRGARVADTGQYECQVSTDPKMNMAVNLTIIATEEIDGIHYKYANIATIKSPREVYVRVGSPVSLKCEIATSSNAHDLFMPSKRVRWLHDGIEITSESDRGGISVDTDYRDRKVTSRLRVSMVTPSDEGLYTCSQAATRQDSIKLYIVEGEHSEAMQRDVPYSSGSHQTKTQIITLLLFLLLYFT